MPHKEKEKKMPFDPKKDKIAITIPKFTLLKRADGPFQKYSEPYIVSVAIDESGKATPKIDFNCMPFPKVAKGGTVTMLGDGHIIYGPKNPGEFVAISVLVMEDDKEIRQLGKDIETVVKSTAMDLGIKAIMVANPGAATVLGILKELTQLVAGFLKNNKNDELYRTEGTFLRGQPVPYHIDRSYDIGNDFVNLNMNIIPLKDHNGEGPKPKQLKI
jgi:hypothetical protein